MNHLIVARWQEDVSWLDSVTGWEPFVVVKDVDLPNVGREAASYLWAFSRLWSRLEPGDRVGCVQADPFPHCEDLLGRLNGEQTDLFLPLGNWHVSDGEGRPDHPDLPIRDRYEQWVGTVFPGRVGFVAGAQFTVDASRVLARPASDHDRLAHEVSCDEKGAWIMERLWVPYLGG